MKRILIIIMILILVLLTGCKAKEAEFELPPLSKYEYYTFEVRCAVDGHTNRLICTMPDNDQTTVSNILRIRTVDGWEVVEVINSPMGDESLLTFIFKREPVPSE